MSINTGFLTNIYRDFSNQPDLLSIVEQHIQQQQLHTPFTPDQISGLYQNIHDFLVEKQDHLLIQKWEKISSDLTNYRLRHACGWTACPKSELFENWIIKNPDAFGSVLSSEMAGLAFHTIDLDESKAGLLPDENFKSLTAFSKIINRKLSESDTTYAVGGYGEDRSFYIAPEYTVKGNDGPKWRTIHLGIDIWAPAGTGVFAPMEGVVYGLNDNAGTGNYGPTVILKHQLEEELCLYTLYGHLSRSAIQQLKRGQFIQKGECFAEYGNADENGNWPPHLHYQFILDMLEYRDDFPGVAFAEEADVWMGICPMPQGFRILPN